MSLSAKTHYAEVQFLRKQTKTESRNTSVSKQNGFVTQEMVLKVMLQKNKSL